MASLFATPDDARALTPLAERMRPRTLSEVAGQAEAVSVLRELTTRRALPSLILWGPPGCGKTTIARLLAGERYEFIPMSAVLAGVKDVREAVEGARRRRELDGRGTLLFLDEIHRFNKAQQDILLPHVEAGTIVLAGATTENPSFEVIGPLLSRCRVLVLTALSAEDIEALLQRALADAERGLAISAEQPFPAEPEAVRMIAELAAGDARFALNTLEVCAGLVGAEQDSSGAGGSARDSGADTAVRPTEAQDEEGLVQYRRRLPHFRLKGSVYFVTWRVMRGQPDLGDQSRSIVLEALLHFKDERYRLQGWVVMNDHVHVLVQPIDGNALEEIIRRWKSFTAHRLQREQGYEGAVWQDEYMDRIMRNEDELFETAQYILHNPLKRWPDSKEYEWVGWDFSKFGEPDRAAGTAASPTEEPADTAVRPTGANVITPAVLKRALAGRALLYDKGGDEHFNAISALHKALRGSDPDAALYWMARMLEGGEDPKYVVRRLIRFASEDIGLADPWALVHAIAAKDSVDFLGMPECNTALAQLCVYLACAPKSNAMYTAYGSAREAVAKHGALPVPLHIRNAPTGLMKELGYGKDYKYAHDFPDGFVPDNYWPDALKDDPPRLVRLTGRGSEKTLLERLRQWWGERFG